MGAGGGGRGSHGSEAGCEEFQQCTCTYLRSLAVEEADDTGGNERESLLRNGVP